MMNTIGGRYEILEKLGGGGMAIVYLARDVYLDRQVAVKVLREEYAEDPEFVRHFHKEAKAVAALNQNNIVNIYDFDANAVPIYIVMEYVDGRNLKQMVMQDGAMSARRVEHIGIQIANGLAEAHRNNIVHKDVKSHNILVDANDNVKITDFGIAQMLSNTTITHNKGILGSAHYFSPEQARGEHVSIKSDMYSLGIVMYEMVTGQVPFTGDNPVTVALKHIQEEPLPPHVYAPDIPKDLESIILKCLEKKPDNRYTTMEDLSSALLRAYDAATNTTAVQSDHFDTASETLSLPKDLTQKNRPLPEPESVTPIKTKKEKRNLKGALVLILIVIFAAFSTLFLVNTLLKPSDVTVPSLKDMTYAEAEAALKEKKLGINKIGEEESADIPVNHIIRQTPAAGSNVKEGREIAVVISKGVPNVSVPDLKGQRIEAATQSLNNLGLLVGKISEDYSSNYAAGDIISQTPEAGKKVDKNSKVDLTVSLGKKITTVRTPDLIGQSLDAAKKNITNAGLVIGDVSSEYSDTAAKDTVIRQTVGSGTQVNAGTAVSLVVSKGKAPKTDNTNTNNTSGKSQNVQVQFSASDSGSLYITQNGTDGTEQLVYSGQYSAGTPFSQSYSAKGSGAYRVYLQEQLIKEVPYG